MGAGGGVRRAQGDPRPYVVEGGPPEHDGPHRRLKSAEPTPARRAS